MEISLKFRQSKGNNSSIAKANLLKRHVHSYTIVIFIQHQFHEISSISYYIMEDGKLLKILAIKGNSSSITKATLMKFHMHNHNMVKNIQYKFHGIPSIGYLVMAKYGRLMDRRMDGWIEETKDKWKMPNHTHILPWGIIIYHT